jgi:Family of unknown function (DUF6879)
VTIPPPSAALVDLRRLARLRIGKVDTLPDYLGDEAEQARRAAFVRTNLYLRDVAVTVLAGKRWDRVRVLDDPLTPGERYAVPGLLESQAAGETVTVLPRDEFERISSALGPIPDFWLFDWPEPDDVGDAPQAFAAVQHFTPDGRFVSREVLPASSPAVAHLVDVYAALQASAVDLNTYLARIDAAARRVGA